MLLPVWWKSLVWKYRKMMNSSVTNTWWCCKRWQRNWTTSFPSQTMMKKCSRCWAQSKRRIAISLRYWREESLTFILSFSKTSMNGSSKRWMVTKTESMFAGLASDTSSWWWKSMTIKCLKSLSISSMTILENTFRDKVQDRQHSAVTAMPIWYLSTRSMPKFSEKSWRLSVWRWPNLSKSW